jgi:hypothetical protein
MPDVSFWETSSDGRRLSRHLGNIHHDWTVDLDERVLAPGAPGRAPIG